MRPDRGSSPVRVAIVEDRDEIREGLRVLIHGTEGYECMGAWSSMEAALPPLRTAVLDVALIDIGLPGMTGIEGIRRLHGERPGLALLVLTVYHDDERIFEALCAGACGYLLKKTPPLKLLESVREAAEGGAPMSPEIARRVVDLFREFRPASDAGHRLTPHEVRVLKLLVEGHNYKTAAAQLDVSVTTVAFHLRQIYEKLQVHSKSEAVAKALRAGIVR